MSGRNIVITGASSGLGACLAYECAKRGENVILLARNIDKLQTIQRDIQGKYHTKVFVYSLDVTNHKAVEHVFGQIFEEVTSIDVLVNNAGYGIFTEADDARIEDVKGMFDVNVYGLISCTQQVLTHMKQNKRGKIINIASQAGKLATPKSSAYAATKHAVLGYTNSLRMELKPFDVLVMAVNPGPISTNFFDVADRSGEYQKNIGKWMLKPEVVATKIADHLYTRRREINLPWYMNSVSVLYSLMPRLIEKLGGKAFYQK
ncbi:SDR family oxidoreductase [Bacillus spongiae]|uniref:SDR family oxidoreductase n=1 Tax=Bacillus spongiae TaxID=2683610 RepID=A0ABU8HFP9_9BACI